MAQDRHCLHVIDRVSPCVTSPPPTHSLSGNRLTNLWPIHDLALWMAGPLLLHLALLTFFSFSSQAAQVSWSSPAAGTVFGPGDTLIVSWTANSTTKVSKNSTTVFRLCETGMQVLQNGTTSCGESVTPLIQQSAGSYTTSLQVAILDHPYISRRMMLTVWDLVLSRMSRTRSVYISK